MGKDGRRKRPEDYNRWIKIHVHNSASKCHNTFSNDCSLASEDSNVHVGLIKTSLDEKKN